MVINVGIAFLWHESCGIWTQSRNVAGNLFALHNESSASEGFPATEPSPTPTNKHQVVLETTYTI